MMEPLLLFETILVEDRPITDLIDSDYTYRSKDYPSGMTPRLREDSEVL